MAERRELSAAGQSIDARALFDEIERLSLLRILNDCLAYASNFATACQALVDLLWREISAECVA